VLDRYLFCEITFFACLQGQQLRTRIEPRRSYVAAGPFTRMWVPTSGCVQVGWTMILHFCVCASARCRRLDAVEN
jgi:hypothetical protein